MGPEGPVYESATLTAYAVVPQPPELRKASIHRPWMNAAPQQFPYRCLPLAMGNQLGWDILNPVTFAVTWNGGPEKTDIKIETPTRQPHPFVLSHFAVGTITFSLGYLFRTPPGVGLLFTGPPNTPIDGFTPCTGYVETEWLPASSTMNWLLTAPGRTVTFEAGTPCCRIIPYPRGFLEQFQPEIRDLAEDPELETQYGEWSRRRDVFNRELNTPGTPAHVQKWQKDYFQGGGSLAQEGVWPDCSDIHQTKFSHKEFVNKRKGPFLGPMLKSDFRRIRVGLETEVWVRAELPNQ